MKVKDYRDLIEKGEEIRDSIQNIVLSSGYNKQDNFDVCGYKLEDIDDFIRVAINIFENIDVK